MNDRVFEAGNAFKDDLFQPGHVALVLRRDLSIAVRWKEKIGLRVRNLDLIASSANFVTIDWSLNFFKGPQL